MEEDDDPERKLSNHERNIHNISGLAESYPSSGSQPQTSIEYQ
jgi:hypothetical protein